MDGEDDRFGRFSAALAAAVAPLAPTIAAAFDDRHLGTDGPWTLYATSQDGKFSWCGAEQYAGPDRMRLIELFPDSATMVATPTRESQAFDGGIAIDGHGDGVQWSTFNGWAAPPAKAT